MAIESTAILSDKLIELIDELIKLRSYESKDNITKGNTRIRELLTEVQFRHARRRTKRIR